MWKVGSRLRQAPCYKRIGSHDAIAGRPNSWNGARKRIFSSNGEAPSSSVKKTAKSISWMSAQVNIHGEHAAQEWASKLSPEARKEVAGLMQAGGGEGSAATITVPEPTKRDLKLVALQNGIPFIGFGIMDNAILILAGDAIDTSLGVVLGISTMCAAAIGNIISDVAGIMLGTVIEDYCAKLGLPVAQISAAQRQLRSVRFANQAGCAVGIVVGCIIGMFPLLLIDSNKIHKLKQEAHMNSIFSDVVEKAKELIGAEITNRTSCCDCYSVSIVVDVPSLLQHISTNKQTHLTLLLLQYISLSIPRSRRRQLKSRRLQLLMMKRTSNNTFTASMATRFIFLWAEVLLHGPQ